VFVCSSGGGSSNKCVVCVRVVCVWCVWYVCVGGVCVCVCGMCVGERGLKCTATSGNYKVWQLSEK